MYTLHLRFPQLFCDLRPHNRREELLGQNDVVIQLNLLRGDQSEEALTPAYCLYALRAAAEVDLAMRLLAVRKAWELATGRVTVEPGRKPPVGLIPLKAQLLGLQKKLNALDQLFGELYMRRLLDATVLLAGNEGQSTQALFRKRLWESPQPLSLKEWRQCLTSNAA
jgi:hypothetical protein